MRMRRYIGQLLRSVLPVNRRTFDILRFEIGLLWQRLKNLTNPMYHLRIVRLRRMGGVSLNVGSGGRGRDGWINIDALSKHRDLYLALDIRRPLPLRNGQVQRLFAEHVIEHLEFREELPRVLTEFHRVMVPGGIVRIVVPDAARFLVAYVSGDRTQWQSLGWDIEALPDDIYTPMHVINHVFHQDGEHQFGFDFETLGFALRRAGFARIMRQQYGESLDHTLAIDRAEHRSYSLYVEAVK